MLVLLYEERVYPSGRSFKPRQKPASRQMLEIEFRVIERFCYFIDEGICFGRFVGLYRFCNVQPSHSLNALIGALDRTEYRSSDVPIPRSNVEDLLVPRHTRQAHLT